MSSIKEPPSKRKSSEICASVDTVEVFFRGRYLPVGIRKSIEQIHGRRIGIEPVIALTGYLQGHRIFVNGPISVDTIIELDRAQRKYQGVVSRFDIAYDFPPHKHEYIKTHAILRWRRKGPMKEFTDGGIYWIGRARTNRNLLLYRRDSKITKQPCAHLELRFQGAPVCRREGVRYVGDLMDLNPRKVFDRHIAWSDIGEKFAFRAVRRAVRDNRQRNHSTSPIVDKYRASIPARVRSIIRRTGHDSAQVRKDQCKQACTTRHRS